jgi:hypothetical protein
MDMVRVSVINALEEIASAVEEVPVSIVQDTTREVLSISAPGFAVTTMNCTCNSESATIRCFCRHLDKRDLLDYSPRTIGA